MKKTTSKASSARIVPHSPAKFIRKYRERCDGESWTVVVKTVELHLLDNIWDDLEKCVMSTACGKAGELGIEDEIESAIRDSSIRRFRRSENIRKLKQQIAEADLDQRKLDNLKGQLAWYDENPDRE
jgi:hypothetical protein